MDQESFRKLLQKPSASTSPTGSSGHVRGSLLAAVDAGKKKQKTVDASQPAFKPRTLKKSAKGEQYRDRAAERRLGVNNDYAQVEALAEDFERKNAEIEDRKAVDEQRKYLGGDSEHTVLVKGLDYALLEQNRARVAAETAATEDVSLEETFLEISAQPKKRTREDILRELKSKRGAPGAESVPPASPTAADKALEEAKKAGKFKPIGFKPIGSSSAAVEGKVKRKKKAKAGDVEENGERKKKRKIAPDAAAPLPAQAASAAEASPSAPAVQDANAAGPSSVAPPKPAPAPEPEPDPVDEDFDIFAGAGEYTGVDLGEDDDDDNDGSAEDRGPSTSRGREDEEGEVPDSAPPRPGKWLATSDDEREPSPPPLPPAARDSKSASRSMSPQRRSAAPHGPPRDEEDGEVEEEEERPMRLQPLASSAMPSIKDMLAMSEEAEKAEKRRMRKEKKKAGGGGGGGGSEKDTKAKVDRDYQRLKAYTEKKSKA
ncbi:RED-like protein N-terminal region-domain-containing protein [Earliella scabrosa]|nr:RED-like protein N-terminal region-domain-containing protein [Earliella scabrosa]